jgi:hemerythrin
MEPWTSNLDVGVAAIDEPHHRIDDLVQVALEAMEKGSVPAVEAALGAIVEEARGHFVAEEALMKQSGYAGVGAHREAHETYLKDFERARKEFAASGIGPKFQLWLSSRLAPWLRLHVRGLDAQFARHYRGWQEEQAKAAEAKLVAEAKAGQEAGHARTAKGEPPVPNDQ